MTFWIGLASSNPCFSYGANSEVWTAVDGVDLVELSRSTVHYQLSEVFCKMIICLFLPVTGVLLSPVSLCVAAVVFSSECVVLHSDSQSSSMISSLFASIVCVSICVGLPEKRSLLADNLFIVYLFLKFPRWRKAANFPKAVWLHFLFFFVFLSSSSWSITRVIYYIRSTSIVFHRMAWPFSCKELEWSASSRSWRRRCGLPQIGLRDFVSCVPVWNLFESFYCYLDSGLGTGCFFRRPCLCFCVFTWDLCDPFSFGLKLGFPCAGLVCVHCGRCSIYFLWGGSFWASYRFLVQHLVVWGFSHCSRTMYHWISIVSLGFLWWGFHTGVCLSPSRLHWRAVVVVFPWVVSTDTVFE